MDILWNALVLVQSINPTPTGKFLFYFLRIPGFDVFSLKNQFRIDNPSRAASGRNAQIIRYRFVNFQQLGTWKLSEYSLVVEKRWKLNVRFLILRARRAFFGTLTILTVFKDACTGTRTPSPRNFHFFYHRNLKKQGDLRNSLGLQGVTTLWHVGQWVSSAPPHHTLPAFLNLNGRNTLISIDEIFICLLIQGFRNIAFENYRHETEMKFLWIIDQSVIFFLKNCSPRNKPYFYI